MTVSEGLPAIDDPWQRARDNVGRERSGRDGSSNRSEDLGFTIAWSDSDLAYLRCGDCSFLLQNFYHPDHAGNFMMHLLVADVEAWWRHVEETQLASKYDVRAEPPADRPWGMRDFTIVDPTGVLWRIAQNTR